MDMDLDLDLEAAERLLRSMDAQGRVQVRMMRTRVDLGLPAGSPTDWLLALVCKIQEELDWED